jgi:TPR repeat protein
MWRTFLFFFDQTARVFSVNVRTRPKEKRMTLPGNFQVARNTLFRLAVLSLGLALFVLAGCSTTAPSTPSNSVSSRETAMKGTFMQGKVAYLSGEYARAREIFMPLASQGHPEAQYVLGYLFFYGLGGDQDLALAQQLFRLSAEQGHADALRAIMLIRQGREQLKN